MTTHANFRLLFSFLILAGAVSLAGCGSEPTETHTTTTTTTEQASPVPAPMATAPLMAPAAPGTVITQTTHSQTAQ